MFADDLGRDDDDDNTVTYSMFVECGRSVRRSRQPRTSTGSASTGRIINGRRSPRGAWPWQLFISSVTALMKLSRPVKLNGSPIRAVCLPARRLAYNETDLCIATGWGRDKEDGKLAGKLLEVRIPVHDNGLCKKKYGHAVPIRNGHLCAGHVDGSSGTCVVNKVCLQGDSGGPLQCARRDGKWFLAGITSFGSGCAKPGFPDVYTRMSYYLPWIKSKMKG
ncbi:transmembrane protease serine [Holotrichia oblita]|uniref:Transmembrane protease serine n=1 Tax=Holotrichia oblita TaxID=644536 RepID=A0ACB9SZM5_HOLOL|nr:transmembrane protease serine [Holotrichia oblita]